MNFLAHLFLAGDDEELVIGNMVADFIRKSAVEDFPAGIQKGIQLHWSIDTYTDVHPIVRQAARRLYPNHGKYAPVVLDILFDYFLAKNWDRYSLLSLRQFTNRTYKTLFRYENWLPPRLKRNLAPMVDKDWLFRSGTIEGLRTLLEGVDKRTKFPSNFAGAIEDVKESYAVFDNAFNIFFPELIAHVEMAKVEILRA